MRRREILLQARPSRAGFAYLACPVSDEASTLAKIAPPTWLLGRLACPACRSEELSAGERAVRCNACETSYDVEEGVPILLPSRDAEGAKARQAEFFDKEADPEYELDRPHGTPAWHGRLLEEKFRRSIAGLEGELAGATVVSVCGGSGLDAEFLARHGGRVACADISLSAVLRGAERGRRHGLEIAGVVADAERLPFRDGAFQLAYVHDGLHHLEDPDTALTEMARVASRAVSVNEPAQAAATAAAVAVGLSESEEEAGNEVRRMKLDEIESALRRSGFDVVGAERYAMLYRHDPGPASHLLSRRALLEPSLGLLAAANRVIGPIGNKLSVRAIRS